MILRELFVKLGLDTDSASFAAGQAAVEGLKLGLHAITTAARAAFGAFEKTGQEAEKLQILATATGLSTTALQEMDYAARLTGTSIEALRAAFVQLSGRALEATRDSSRNAAFAFQRLGVRFQDGAGKIRPLNELLEDIVANVDKVQGGERLGIIRELFGRGQAHVMLSLLKDGKEGLVAMFEEAHRFGFVMGEEAVEAMAKFDDQMDKIGLGFMALRRQIVIKTLPVVRALTDAFLGFVTDADGPVRRSLAFLEQHWRAIAVVAGSFLLPVVVKLGAALAMAAGRAIVAWGAVLAPFVAWGLVISTLILLWEDFMVGIAGGDSLVGDLAKRWGAFYDDLLRDRTDEFWLLRALRAVGRALADVEGTLARLGFDFRAAPSNFDVMRALTPDAIARVTRTGAMPTGINPQARAFAPVINNNVTVNAGAVDDKWAVADAFARKLAERNQAMLREAAEAAGGP